MSSTYTAAVVALLALTITVVLAITGTLGDPFADLPVFFIEPSSWYWWIGPLCLPLLLAGIASLRLHDDYLARLYGVRLVMLAPAAAFVLWTAGVYAWYLDGSHWGAAVLFWVACLPTAWHIGRIGLLAVPHAAPYFLYCIPFVFLSIWFEFASGYALTAALGGGGRATVVAVVFLWLKAFWTVAWAVLLCSPEIAAMYLITFVAILAQYAGADVRNDVTDRVGVPLIVSICLHGTVFVFYGARLARRWALHTYGD